MKRDKLEAWNSLSAIDQVGMMEYAGITELTNVPSTSVYQRSMISMWAQRSLLIRPLVRRPFRNRNIREMRINRNLRHENGHWLIEFRGNELKVGRVHGRINFYRILFPDDLVAQLEEVLTVWRPILLGSGLPELFTTSTGWPFTHSALNTEFKKVVYAYTSRATNMHLMRDIWVTEFLEQLQDFATAEMLGDTVETVLRHYAHLQNLKAGVLAGRFHRRACKQLM